jgi:serine protease
MRVSRLFLGSVVSAAAVLLVTTAVPAADQIFVQGIRVPSVSVPRIPTPGTPGSKIDPVAAPRASVQGGPRRLTAARAEAFAEAARRGLNYLPGEVVVKFRSGMGAASVQRALDAVSSRPNADGLEWHSNVALLRDPSQPDAHQLAAQLSAQPEVEFAEPNYIARINPIEKQFATGGAPVPTPPDATTRLWRSAAFRTTGTPSDTDFGAYQWNFNLINMPAAWDVVAGGSTDLIVAVVDTGITVAAQTLTFPLWTGSAIQNVQMQFAVNPDLPASRLVLPRDYAFLDPQGPVVDMEGHGTHVSGTVGQATNNAFLTAGMAYNVKIMPVKVCSSYWDLMIVRAQNGQTGFISADSGGCSFVDMSDGIRYAADNGAKVINMSLGGTSQSTLVRDALAYAVSRGVFVALSTGNDFEEGNPTQYPARYAIEFEGVMSVASVAKNSAKAYYSSTGSYVEIAAPGGDSRQGTGTTDRGLIWQSTLLGADSQPGSGGVIHPRFDRYDKQSYQGTSMASPHVAGLAALIMSQTPGISPAMVERIIRTTAKDIGDAGRDNSFGNGLIQPRTALYGHSANR